MNKIEFVMYIEGLSSDKKALERTIEELVKSIRGEKDFEVESMKRDEIIETGEEPLRYSSLIEIRGKGSLEGIFKGVVRYSPAVMEILSPPKMEISAQRLANVLADVSLMMQSLMNQFGPLAAYPDLKNRPVARIGYSRDEVEDMILNDRYILSRLVVEVAGASRGVIEEDLPKALELEGCAINKYTTKLEERNGKYFGLVAFELLSDFETLVQLVAKYAPVGLEIVEPEEIDITAGELQNALTDLSGFVQVLVTRPVQEFLTKKKQTKELSDFHLK